MVSLQDVVDFFHTGKADGSVQIGNTEADSVFDLEYIPTSKDLDYTVLTSGYFTVNDMGQPAVESQTQASDPFSLNNGSDGTFWQIIVTAMNETHEENFALHNTIGDNIAVFAAGAKPIAVNIRGYVLFSGEDDYNYLLLRNYVDHFRARHLSANSSHLTFRLKDTNFRLIIENIALGHRIEFETYVDVAISGLAYYYGQNDSLENLRLGYDGKFAKTVARRSELLSLDNSEAQQKDDDSANQANVVKEEAAKKPFQNPDSAPGEDNSAKPPALRG